MGTVAGLAHRRRTGAQGGAFKRATGGAAGRTPVPVAKSAGAVGRTRFAHRPA